MAKNESTAINELINLVSTATPRKLAPDEDLMFTPPPKTKAKPSNPRMTGTLSGAGEVEPLPRGRGAMGTQQSSVSPSPVRVTTAPPSRATTIPPLGAAPARAASPAGSVAASAVGSPALMPGGSPGGSVDDAPMLFEDTPLPAIVSEDSAPWVIPAGRLTRPSLPPPSRTTPPPPSMPVVAPFSSSANAHASVDLTDQSWFEESRAVERVAPVIAVEDSFGTAEVPKRASTTQWLIKLALPMGAMIVIGVFVGGYLAFDGQGGHKRNATTSAASAAVGAPLSQDSEPAAATESVTEPVVMKVGPAAAPEPVAVEPAAAAPAAAAEPVKTEPAVIAPPAVVTAPAVVAAPAPAAATPVVTGKRPVFVDVRLDSNPSGATVMLVDRGKTTFLGTTPISTAVDPSRQYDLVFTYKDRPTRLEHLDPRTTTKLAVKIERKSGSETAKAKKTETLAETAVAKSEPAPRAEKIQKTEAPVVNAEAPVAAKAEPVGEGVLMISSKPPCEILIDGKPTGLMTPQRALPLKAGAHKVTLVNTAEKIKKTLSIQITADQPTKVIQDLMNH